MTRRSSISSSKVLRGNGPSLVSKVLLFVLVFIVIDYLLNGLYRSMMASTNVVTVDRAFFRGDLNKVQVLVLGDSHAMFLWPNYSRRPLANWASEGERYIQHYYKLKAYVTKHHPRAVVLPIDLHSFSALGLGFGHDFFWVRYVDYFELAALTGQYRLYMLKYLSGRFFPYAGQQGVVLQWIAREMQAARGGTQASLVVSPAEFARIRPSPPPPQLSYSALNEQQKLLAAKWRAMQMMGTWGFQNEFVVEYFRRTLTLCRQNKIEVFLVRFPVSEEFFRCATAITDEKAYYGEITRIAREYANAHIIDTHDIFFGRPELLANTDHPNLQEGTRELNQRVFAEIDRVLDRIPD